MLPFSFAMLPYRYNAGSFFANWAAVLLCLLTAQSIGLLVGSVVTHPKTGQTIATITALTMVLVSSCNHPSRMHVDHVFDISHALGWQGECCHCIPCTDVKDYSDAVIAVTVDGAALSLPPCCFGYQPKTHPATWVHMINIPTCSK